MAARQSTPRICEQCGALLHTGRRYCSRACFHIADTQDVSERFWALVHKTFTCWRWLGSVDRKGYGYFSYRGKLARAHRVAFVLEHDRWPTPCALHACDTPVCVRVGPGHIFEGTPADNSADMARKGRVSHGEHRHCHVLTAADIPVIRALAATGVPSRVIAQQFPVTARTIRRVINRNTWDREP